jgi:hypothetical protein
MARPKHHSGNLPAEATSFIGRRHELAELRIKLTTARLISLVGPGGVGITRLAIRIATIPGFFFEVVMPFWLIVKGFNPEVYR